MRILSFHANGFRSLADVRLDRLGPINVFYGPNGAGKSNLMDALRLWLAAPGAIQRGTRIRDQKWFQPGRLQVSQSDVAHGAQAIELGGCLDLGADVMEETELTALRRLSFAVRISPKANEMVITSLTDQDERSWLDTNDLPWWNWFARVLPERAFELVPAGRSLGPEPKTQDDSFEARPTPRQLVRYLLRQGRLKEALVRAMTSPDHSVRRDYRTLAGVLQDAPLCRPALEPVDDVTTGHFELYEVAQDGTTTALDRVGLGIVQMYAMLGHALLLGTSAVGIEEPEAHLHAPTTGIHARQLLRRLVDEGHLKQLFVATHSNLFDLDPTGYWEVEQDEQGQTRVERVEDLTRIDEQHLYEPGPAKRAFQQMLRFRDRSEVVFRLADGTEIEAGEMLDWLQHDDPRAVDFLRDMAAAAVKLVGARARRRQP